jgi:hypothetical protein
VLGFKRMLMRRGDDHQRRTRRFSGLNPDSGILKNQTLRRFQPQTFSRQQITRRIRLARLHILSRNHHRRLGNPRRRHPPQRQIARRRRHHGPTILWQLIEKRRRPRNLDNAFNILDLRCGNKRRLCLRVHARQVQAIDRVDRPRAMNGRQKRLDIDAMAHGPG